MEKAEAIQHQRRFEIFEHLQNARILLKMKVIGHGYEHLTVVTGTRLKKNTPFFMIDCPEDFEKVAAGLDDCRMDFEFIGTDNIIYNFKTSGQEIIKNEVCIRFPEAIYRLQRRNDFRVIPPVGTKLKFYVNQNAHELSVLNISRTGALTIFTDTGKKDLYPGVFSIGAKLKGIELVFPVENQTAKIELPEIRIKRLGKNPSNNKKTCAFQFVNPEKEQEKKLVRLLYKFQRDLLQKKMADI